MRISAALPSGVTALLFEAAAARRALEGRLVPALEQAGFSEALLPILDYAAPYEPLLTPRRRGELYRFVDRSGELLALRADFTPLLARLLTARPVSADRLLQVIFRLPHALGTTIVITAAATMPLCLDGRNGQQHARQQTRYHPTLPRS